MKALEGETDYNRVIVKHGGTDEAGASVTFTEELSQTDEYGVLDWNCMGMAFREFVSNAIDAAIAVNRQANGNVKWPWDGVKVELVPEEKVRAKRGYTRVFVPADNEEVIRFFANLGKWFLHFSEPEAITQAILAKKSRNLDADCHTAVIYRRGVRVREIDQYSSETLFDYNLNDLRVDESRNVDDYRIIVRIGCGRLKPGSQTKPALQGSSVAWHAISWQSAPCRPSWTACGFESRRRLRGGSKSGSSIWPWATASGEPTFRSV